MPRTQLGYVLQAVLMANIRCKLCRRQLRRCG